MEDLEKDLNQWCKASDILVEMESTEGWQWLKRKVEKDINDFIEEILKGGEKDEFIRGQLSYARNLFDKIKRAHSNKRNLLNKET